MVVLAWRAPTRRARSAACRGAASCWSSVPRVLRPHPARPGAGPGRGGGRAGHGLGQPLRQPGGLGPLALGIAAFCSVLFIRGLGLPLPLVGPWLTPATGRRRAGRGAGPRPPPRRRRSREPAPWNSSANLGLGFETALSPWNLLYAFVGCCSAPRSACCRPRAGADHRHAAAPDLRPAAGLGPDHAGRHLLRRPVRRLDDRHPDQPARRELLGGDRDRRLPDGQAGPGRQGPGDRGPGLVLRRHGRHPDPGRARRRWPRWRSSSARPSTSRSWCWAWWPRWRWPRARCSRRSP